MEIYIRLDTENCGTSWYRHDKNSGCGSYLCAGKDLETVDLLGYEYMRGSAAKSWKEVKQWTKDARMLANVDGMGRTHVSYWKWSRGHLVQAKMPRKKAQATA